MFILMFYYFKVIHLHHTIFSLGKEMHKKRWQVIHGVGYNGFTHKFPMDFKGCAIPNCRVQQKWVHMARVFIRDDKVLLCFVGDVTGWTFHWARGNWSTWSTYRSWRVQRPLDFFFIWWLTNLPYYIINSFII